MEKLACDNERYIGYVLPLKIEEAIYDALHTTHENNPNLGIELVQHSKDRMGSLKDKLDHVDKKIADIRKKRKKDDENTAETELVLSNFDKNKYFMPDFKK